MITVHKKLSIANANKGRKKLKPKREAASKPLAKVPRISRLMALAIKYQGMLDRGEVSGVTELARLCHVTQPRMSQILNLNLLSSEIQEDLLFIPHSKTAKQAIHEKNLRAVCAQSDWSVQRREFYQSQLGGRKVPIVNSENL
ncbi:MAG TPA: hypothetical protein PKD64_17845 [Pirellulaceae bacterium]|nr:hypothetical protein [Pirellulaceae bacterium]HMO94052.1 hypothetical protein [Pirellulaceae bacterium]HMP70942.1 hypothetical protein [Pirellulaceae bacterium]